MSMILLLSHPLLIAPIHEVPCLPYLSHHFLPYMRLPELTA